MSSSLRLSSLVIQRTARRRRGFVPSASWFPSSRFLSTTTFLGDDAASTTKILSWKVGVATATGLGLAVAAASSCLSFDGGPTVMEAAPTATAAAVEEQEQTQQGTKDESNDDTDDNDNDNDETTTTILNWSGTHAVHVSNSNYWEPETVQELQEIVQKCHDTGTPVRPVGSALSPNGLSFHQGGMVSLANLDQILTIDTHTNTVTVQAGARVSQVVEALKVHNLTLPNLASIAEQQMGGFVQVGAHGTGANVAPVDEYVTSLQLVTPARGTLHLDPSHGELFQMAKVGLGCLGIVTQVTMQCIPSHNLVEHTFVLTRAEAKKQLNGLLKSHKHVRYMWIPYEDAVVVVTNDPEEDFVHPTQLSPSTPPAAPLRHPMKDLLLELSLSATDDKAAISAIQEMVASAGFGELRDALLAIGDPLDVNHVKRVNKAEAEFWRLHGTGYRTKPSEELLQFDSGGQQWVLEVCFPTGSVPSSKGSSSSSTAATGSNGADMIFLEKLLTGIEEQNIAAPSPIEQRWSSSSSSLMSPAHGSTPDGLHSWVGIIMYLPPPSSDEETKDNDKIRANITKRFKEQYCDLLRSVGKDVNAVSHWAKLEFPTTVYNLLDVQESLQKRYPLDIFNAARASLDPKNILANPLINITMGAPCAKPDSRN